MNNSKFAEDADKSADKLRNFDLSVDEIRLMKSINEMTQSVKNIERSDPNSPRAKFIRLEIEKLENQLEDLRDNTLIR
ncbi:MAG: hypothetical protein QNJ56_01505 [Gammaproteobacteria bacterium]|nr:hypothetical protein [Gammaproteobacteria bacterium]